MGKGVGQIIVGAIAIVASLVIPGSQGWLTAMGASLIASGGATMLSKPPKLGIRASDLGQNISDPVAALAVVYGKVRVGGARVFMEAPSPGRSLWLAIAFSHGPVAGIDEIYVDGELATETDGRGKGEYANLVTAWKAYGTDSQPGVVPQERGAINVVSSIRLNENERRLTLDTAHSFLVGHVVRCTGVVGMENNQDYHLVQSVPSSTQIVVARYDGGPGTSGGGGTVDFFTPDPAVLFGSRWGAMHAGKGVAWAFVRIRWNERFTTLPRVEAVVRGRAVVDPRASGTTRTVSSMAAGPSAVGAATSIEITTSAAHGYAEGDLVVLSGYSASALNGTHRVDRIVSSTVFRVYGPVYAAGTGGTLTKLAYSTNPAVCIRDYLASPIYGIGALAAELDDTAIAAEANYHDEILNVPLENTDAFTNQRRISQIVVAAGVATVTTTTAHQYATGNTVRISGMDAATVLNGNFVVTVTGASTFTYATAETNGTYIPPTQERHRYTYIAEVEIVFEQMAFASVLKTQKRFEISGVVNTANPVKENLEDILTSCRGMLVYQGGKYRPLTRRPSTAHALALTEANIIGDFEYALPGQRDLANVVRAAFLDATKGYTVNFVDYPAPGMPNGFLTEDNNQRLARDIELPFTTSRVTAQQVAMVTRRESRNGIGMSLTCTEAALAYAVGNVANVTHPSPGFVAKPFWVVAIAILPTALVRLTLQEYDATAYDLDAQDDTPFAPNTVLPIPPLGSADDPIAVPTDLAAAFDTLSTKPGGGVEIAITYTPPTSIFFKQIDYEVRSRPRGSGTAFSTLPARIMVGSGHGSDRYPAAFDTEYEVTPVTYTTNGTLLRGTGSAVKTVTIPNNPVASPTFATPVAMSDRIVYGVTFDTLTTRIEVWSTEYASDPGVASSRWNVGTKFTDWHRDDGRSQIAISLAASSNWLVTTRVAFNALDQVGTISTVKTQGASPTRPANITGTPVVAVNTDGTVVEIDVPIPADVVTGPMDKLALYRDGVKIGTVARTAAASTNQRVVHSGLNPATAYRFAYKGETNAGVESLNLSPEVSVTTPSRAIPAPTIALSAYNWGSQGFDVQITPAAGTPAGVTWQVKHSTASGGPYTDAESGTSTTIFHGEPQQSTGFTDFVRVHGVAMAGWTQSADSNTANRIVPASLP